MFRLTPLTALLPAAFLAMAVAVAAAPPLPAPQLAGPQLERGETLYLQACAICHGDRLEGGSGPSLGGEAFQASFGGLPPLALHTLIRDTMPEGARGTLSPQEVLDVTAYLLRENGQRLPEAGLSVEALEHRLPPGNPPGTPSAP